MVRSTLLRGASAAALSLASPLAANAQQALPSIEIGAARPARPPRAAPAPALVRPAAAAPAPRPTPIVVERGGPQDPTAYKVTSSSMALKTDTPILRTPVSVQVVPKQVIADQQAITIDKATQNVSNVFVTPYQGLQGGWNIRGFLDWAYYQDGVRVNPYAALPPRDTVDVQQVEVVKGPASILYGRMQPGGMVEVTTKMPQAERHFEAQQQFASFSGFRTTVSATGPIAEDKSLLYRLDASWQSENSFIDALHNRHTFVAPKLLWTPTQDTSMLFYLNFYSGLDGMNAGIPGIYDPNVPKSWNSVAQVPRSRNYGSPDFSMNTKYDVRVGYKFIHEFNEDWKISQRLDLNFRDFNEGWVDVYNPDPTACTALSCPVFRDVAKFSNKEQNYFISLDLTGRFRTGQLEHSILVGADGYRANDYVPFPSNFSLVPATDLFNPGYPTNLMPFNLLPDAIAAYKQTESWYGVYAQDQVKLPYNVELLAGFRYDSARVNSNYVSFAPTWSESPSANSADRIKPRVALLWRPVPQLTLYGNYIEGFGIANGMTVSKQSLPPEQATQWEGGAKLALFDEKLTATASWFHIVKKNVASPAGPGILAGSQVTGAVRNTGVEFDVQGQVTPELKVIGSFATIDSKIITDINGGKAGNHWWGVPRNSGNFWGVYEPQWEPVRGLAVGAGFTARGSMWVDRNNSFTVPAYAVANLMTRYSFDYQKTKMTLQFNVDNLFDKTYYTAAGWTGGFIANPPRMFRGSLKVEF